MVKQKSPKITDTYETFLFDRKSQRFKNSTLRTYKEEIITESRMKRVSIPKADKKILVLTDSVMLAYILHGTMSFERNTIIVR